jgi:LmbE family N-acetylglucosaminyl deacetylase
MIVDGFGLPSELPPILAQNANALRMLYPQAEYRLWDGNSVRDVISSNFEPEVLEAFETLQPYSYKCDLARYCLLYLFGGLYVDLGIRCINQLRPPADVGVASFRDNDLLSPCWTAAANGIIWARPGRREFRIALDYILENCRDKYYGRNPLYVSGPVVWGRALAAGKAEKRQQADADDQWIGVSRPVTPGQRPQNECFVAPDHSIIAMSVKRLGGDLTHLGAAGTNNYNVFWHSRTVYGEDMCWLFNDPAIRLTERARRTESGIVANPGVAGRLTFGPYISLEPGNYRLSISLVSSGSTNAPRMLVDVTYDKGREQIHVHRFEETGSVAPEVIEFEFAVSKPLQGVEFRFSVFGPFEAEITQYKLARIRDSVSRAEPQNRTPRRSQDANVQVPQLVRTFAEPSVVVFAPHMDDEVIGPGGTIALHRQAGATVSHVFMTDGLGSDPELNARRMPADELERRLRELGETRKRESAKAAELVGIKELIFLDAPDGKLHETSEILDRVRQILDKKKPNLIYAPSVLDNHPDHRATNRILRFALESLPEEITSEIRIRGYEVWTPVPANRMVDISPVEALKREAVNVFASQTRFVDYARAILGLNQYRSMMHLGGRSTAEAVWECTWDEYRRLVDKVLLNEFRDQAEKLR